MEPNTKNGGDTFYYYWQTTVQLLQVPSFILYVLFLAVLIRHRKQLGSRFFDFCISLGIADVASFLKTSVEYVLFYYSGIRDWPVVARQIYARTANNILLAAVFGEIGGVNLLVVNRFTAVVFPLKHHQLWKSSRVFAVSLCSQWLLPIIVVASVPFLPLVTTNSTLHVGFIMAPDFTVVLFSTFFLYIGVSVTVMVVLYAWMLGHLVKKRLKRGQSPLSSKTAAEEERQRKRRLTELKLSVVGVILTLSLVVYEMETILVLLEQVADTPAWLKTAIASFGGSDALYKYVDPFVTFTFVFSNPYSVLAMSTSVRQHFLEFVGWRKTATVGIAPNAPGKKMQGQQPIGRLMNVQEELE